MAALEQKLSVQVGHVDCVQIDLKEKNVSHDTNHTKNDDSNESSSSSRKACKNSYHDEIDEAGEDKVLNQLAADAACADDEQVRLFGLLSVLGPIGHGEVVFRLGREVLYF